MFQITNNLPWISINGQIIRLVHPFFRYCCFKNSTMSCWEQFWYSLTKNFQITFYLPSISACKKNHADWCSCSWSIADLKILKCDYQGIFLTIPDQTFTNHLLRFLNPYSPAKNQVHSSTLTWGIAKWRILKSDSIRTFLTRPN